MSRPLLLRGAEMKEAVKELWCSNIYESSHKHLEELAPSCYNIKNAIEIQNIRGEKAWLKIIMFPNSLSKDLHLL